MQFNRREVMKKLADNSVWDYFFVAFILVSCNVIKNMPAEKKGIESLDGAWKLEATNDDNALMGTTISVYPLTADGLITTLQNNSYCVRPSEVIWKDITTASHGGFSIHSLTNSCISSLVYKPATLTLLNNDEIKLTGQTASGKELEQIWKRVSVQKELISKR
jgi:hypothetical protein